jgi:hypothetical protein
MKLRNIEQVLKRSLKPKSDQIQGDDEFIITNRKVVTHVLYVFLYSLTILQLIVM